MFDPETIALIRQAPPLEGLDLEALPQLLTEAFATVVAARIRLRTGAPDSSSVEIEQTLAMLTRLAAAQEVLVAQLTERDNRAAAAFVAGTAHQTRRLARVGVQEPSRITATAVSSEISSALLFLIAEAYPDAAEASKRINPAALEDASVERSLLSALKSLTDGRLNDAVSEPPPPLTAESSVDRAVEALLGLLLTGVRSLALQLSGFPSDRTAARRIFQRVKALCIEKLPASFADGRPAYSAFSGPLHLANLLIAAERDLIGSALSHLPVPSGVETIAWSRMLQRMARSRPFLWRNHKVAIQCGYLEHGRSAAISFPTGGGKSTLAELKIAATLLRGEQVVFLAPTHALVAQTVKALQKTFREASVFGDVDEEVTLSTILTLPEVIVTTPERCLMLLAMQPEAFENLGLVVFDECHLLHARQDDRSRRGLDSMLCLLSLIYTAPNADLLLMSAMMKNTAEIAGWLKGITGRECLALDLAWKPTRQARGCVVYDMAQLNILREKLEAARIERPTQASVPAKVRRELMAQPLGFFGLRQTWNTKKREDYALRALLNGSAPLGTSSGTNWYLTPSGNQVSTAIAAGSVAAGMKTLIFVQSTIACRSCVSAFSKHLTPREVTLSEEEAQWRALVVEEMGGTEHCYLAVDEGNKVCTGAASHHALLLREERDLHESLFKRRDGIDALFATSTLAQGMNLPSEVVIICGDSRFDPQLDKLKQLEAHELLNAAGRAGRAGEGSQGFVILVPSHVIGFDQQNSLIGKDWIELQAIFEQPDQCLIIDDPLEASLDLIHAGITDSGTGAYLLGRLPMSVEAGKVDPAVVMLRHSFAAYRRKQSGDESWISSRIEAALAARPAAAVQEDNRWIGLVAAATGLSIELLNGILSLVDCGALKGDAGQVMETLLDWIGQSPVRLFEMMRPESLEGLFGEGYKKLPTDTDRAVQALAMIKMVLPIWMSGAPVRDIEAAIEGKTTNLGHCETARHFVTRVVSDLAFVAGLPGRLLLARHAATSPGDAAEVPTVLAVLGSVVREGCHSPEALAARLEAGRKISRVAARRLFDKASAHLITGAPTEPFEATQARVRTAMIVAMFDDDTGSRSQ